MDVESLRCFVVAASTLSFTRASQLLYMTQSTASRRIAKLEADLGVMLFDRTGAALTLTDAGEVLVEEAEKILALTDRLPGKLQRLQRNVEGSLRIGHYGFFDMPVLTELITKMGRKHPNIRISLYQDKFALLVEALSRGEADIVFTITNEAEALSDVVTQPLMPLRMCAALHKSHPLAGRESVSIEELREEPIIWWRRSSAPVVYDAIQSACAGQGFVPKVTETKNSPYDVLLSVAAGQGVGFLMDEIAHMGGEGIGIVPIDGLALDAYYGAAYIPGRSNSCASIFWYEMMEYLQSAGMQRGH